MRLASLKVAGGINGGCSNCAPWETAGEPLLNERSFGKTIGSLSLPKKKNSTPQKTEHADTQSPPFQSSIDNQIKSSRQPECIGRLPIHFPQYTDDAKSKPPKPLDTRNALAGSPSSSRFCKNASNIYLLGKSNHQRRWHTKMSGRYAKKNINPCSINESFVN